MVSEALSERIQSMTAATGDLVDAWDLGDTKPAEGAEALVAAIGVARLVLGGSSYEQAKHGKRTA